MLGLARRRSCGPAPSLVACAQETLNQFVFNFASRPAQLSRAITFDLLGIPQDYLFRRVPFAR